MIRKMYEYYLQSDYEQVNPLTIEYDTEDDDFPAVIDSNGDEIEISPADMEILLQDITDEIFSDDRVKGDDN